MTDPDTFHVPIKVTAMERVCTACKNGFYRSTGKTIDLIIAKDAKRQFVHECPKCHDEQSFDITYPVMNYDAWPQLNWMDEDVRKRWVAENEEYEVC